MILVTIGTSEPFDRLLEAIDQLPGDEELIVQHGTSRVRPSRAACLDFLTFSELLEQIRSARAVVTHAGVGSVLTVLREGKRPIVVPRQRRFGEAIDDHQLAFGRRLADTGLVILVDDLRLLGDALNSSSLELAPVATNGATKLSEELRAYLSVQIAQ